MQASLYASSSNSQQLRKPEIGSVYKISYEGRPTRARVLQVLTNSSGDSILILKVGCKRFQNRSGQIIQLTLTEFYQKNIGFNNCIQDNWNQLSTKKRQVISISACSLTAVGCCHFCSYLCTKEAASGIGAKLTQSKIGEEVGRHLIAETPKEIISIINSDGIKNGIEIVLASHILRSQLDSTFSLVASTYGRDISIHDFISALQIHNPIERSANSRAPEILDMQRSSDTTDIADSVEDTIFSDDDCCSCDDYDACDDIEISIDDCDC